MSKLANEFSDIEHGDPDSVIISEASPQGIILNVNDNFCEISGYSREELIGQPHNIIRHPSMPKELFQRLWSTIQKGEVYRGIIKNRRKDGGHYWADIIIIPIVQNHQIARYVGGRHVISDEKLAEDLFSQEAKKFGWPT